MKILTVTYKCIIKISINFSKQKKTGTMLLLTGFK